MRQWGWLPGILGAFSVQVTVAEFELMELGGGRWQSDDSLMRFPVPGRGGEVLPRSPCAAGQVWPEGGARKDLHLPLQPLPSGPQTPVHLFWLRVLLGSR